MDENFTFSNFITVYTGHTDIWKGLHNLNTIIKYKLIVTLYNIINIYSEI